MLRHSFVKPSSRLVSIIAIFFLLWIFARPLSSVMLCFYKFSAAHVYKLLLNVREVKKDALDLLSAEEKLKQLVKENQELKLERTLFKARLQELEAQNRQLDYISRFQYSIIPAQVIGRSPDTWHRQLILNKGSKHGVKIGQGVISNKSIIGQISKLADSTAIVQLSQNPDWRMGIKIKRTGQLAVIRGNYPANPHLELLPVDSDIQIGDWVLSSGICINAGDCPYPPDLPLGQVVEVRKDPKQVDLTVKVALLEDLSKIQELYIIR